MLLQAWSCFHHLMVFLLFHTGFCATYQCHWPYGRSVCVSTNFNLHIMLNVCWLYWWYDLIWIELVFIVLALRSIHESLIDPNGHLSNWKDDDPCLSNWTGVVCSNETVEENFLHVVELYDLYIFKSKSSYYCDHFFYIFWWVIGHVSILTLYFLTVGNYWGSTCLELWHQILATLLIWKYCKIDSNRYISGLF